MTDITKLLTLFDKWAYGKQPATAFNELVDTIIIPFKVCGTPEEAEAQLAIVTGHPRKDTLASIANCIGELSEGFRDPLGELYMQKVSHGHMGQYFTPEHVCDLMAQCSIETPKDGSRVLDPACGSGRMLLAAAKINRHLICYGADVDITCCKMALLNMLLQSLTGEIANMDSLSNEFFTGYKARTTLLNGFYHPNYVEFTEPEKSAIWLRPKAKPDIVFPEKTAGTYHQTTLF